MNIVAIIQARMGSTRLPGKVLFDIGRETMLARVVKRTGRARLVNEVTVATTTSEKDDALVAECERLNVPLFRGSEDNVLDRYYHAARAFGAEVIVRITSDCPLIDPTVIDLVVREFLDGEYDYVSNVRTRWFPRGLDTEVLTFGALERAWREARETFEREHVTPYLSMHPEVFRLGSVTAEQDYSVNRWTVDTPQDLKLARAIYARLGNVDTFSWREALAVVEREPALAELNRDVRQKELGKG